MRQLISGIGLKANLHYELCICPRSLPIDFPGCDRTFSRKERDSEIGAADRIPGAWLRRGGDKLFSVRGFSARTWIRTGLHRFRVRHCELYQKRCFQRVNCRTDILRVKTIPGDIRIQPSQDGRPHQCPRVQLPHQKAQMSTSSRRLALDLP